MDQLITNVMIQLVRICGLIALGTGALSWFAYSSPLLVHVVSGGLLVSALCILAFQSRSSAGSLTLLAVAIAVVVPLLGLLELKPILGELQWALPWLHPVAGIGSIGLAEVLAKRIKSGQRSV